MAHSNLSTRSVGLVWFLLFIKSIKEDVYTAYTDDNNLVSLRILRA